MNIKKQEKIEGKLKNSIIGFAGAGGLGSNAAVSLARTGVSKLIIVDFDKIEKSNLNRQYYFKDQIGKVKVEALKDNIKKINPVIDVQTYNEKLIKGSMHNHFSNCDIVIEALDSADAKTDFIEDIMSNYPKKHIISASGVTGYGNFEKIKIKHLGFLHIIFDEEAKDSENDVLTSARVSIFANAQANLALELILGEGK